MKFLFFGYRENTHNIQMELDRLIVPFFNYLDNDSDDLDDDRFEACTTKAKA